MTPSGMKAMALLAVLVGGCVSYGGSTRHVVYVDGYAYFDHGVALGDPPPDTIIPKCDPPVGQLAPADPE